MFIIESFFFLEDIVVVLEHGGAFAFVEVVLGYLVGV
jgi:hypothetical protein